MSLGFDSHLLRAVPVGLGGHNSTSHTNYRYLETRLRSWSYQAFCRVYLSVDVCVFSMFYCITVVSCQQVFKFNKTSILLRLVISLINLRVSCVSDGLPRMLFSPSMVSFVFFLEITHHNQRNMARTLGRREEVEIWRCLGTDTPRPITILTRTLFCFHIGAYWTHSPRTPSNELTSIPMVHGTAILR